MLFAVGVHEHGQPSCTPDRPTCLRTGYIRYIDSELGCLSVATPLPPDAAQDATAIIRGALELPQEIDLGDAIDGSRCHGNGRKPYTMPAIAHGNGAVGTSARSSRANLMRRKNG